MTGIDVALAQSVPEALALFAAASVDPEARISPSLWRRVGPVFDQARALLVEHPAAGPSVEADLALLAAEPSADAPYDRVVAEARRLCSSDAALAAAARGLAVRVSEFARLFPRRGSNAAGAGSSEPLSQQAAALQKRLRPVRGALPDRVAMTVVLSFRVPEGDPYRLRNLLACLLAVSTQTRARGDYRVVAVEQDRTPRLKDLLAPYVDSYRFAYNPGAFNYAWGRNVGAKAHPGDGAVCLLDVDMPVSPDFVAACLEALTGSVGAVLPYDEVFYLDERSSSLAAGRLAEEGDGRPLDHSLLRGYVLREIRGGAVAATQEVYRRVGGQDERFRGWGDEDNEFYFRLRETTEVRRLLGTLPHLHHPRPLMRVDGGKRINQAALDAPRPLGGAFGDSDRYRAES
ncbi:galactosyltransferase-related protein [Streptomyces sp. NPDC054770]